MTKSQIFIADKGDIVEYKNGKMRMSGRVQAGNILIDGIGVGDVGNIVLTRSQTSFTRWYIYCSRSL